jgi:hypothetical protein
MTNLSPEFWAALGQFGVALTALGVDLLEKLRVAKVERNEVKARRIHAAADYFQDLATSLTKVADELHNNRIPHTDGRELKGLLYGFHERTQGIADSRALKASIDEAVKLASELDLWLSNNPAPLGEREHQQVVQIKRIAGDCAGFAGRLKSVV